MNPLFIYMNTPFQTMNTQKSFHSFLRNEVIARVLYLCKDVETFGSGIRKIYNLCEDNGVSINYIDSDTDFVFSFSRFNRNIMPSDDTINGTISDGENEILEFLRKYKNITVAELSKISNKSVRTINRIISLLKSKGLIERIGSNKNGYWKVK